MERPLFTNCTLFHDELFAVGVLGGLPAKINLCSGRMEYYDAIESLIVRRKNVIIDFLENFQEKIYALDSDGKNLAIFNLGKYQCRYIPLHCNCQTEINFVAFERYDLDYYIFPKHGNKILIFNTEEEKISKTSWCLEKIDIIQCTCRVGNCVWILPEDTDMIYCYDLSKKETKRYELKKILYNCVHAIFQDGCIYILNTYGIIYIWNIEKRELNEITIMETEHDEKMSVGRIIYAGGNLILLPAKSNNIKILDLSTKKIQVYHDYPEDFDDQTVWLKFYGYCEDDRYYYFAMCACNYLLKIEKQSGELIWIKPQISGKTAMHIYFEKGNIDFKESQIFGISDLIEFSPESKYQECKTNIGKEIYIKM